MKKSWLDRGKEGTKQEKNYVDKSVDYKMNFSDIEEKIKYLNEVKNTEEYDNALRDHIIGFIEQDVLLSTIKKTEELPIKVEMKDISPNIYGKLLNDNIKRYNKKIVETLDNFLDISEDNFKNKDLFNFIYVVQRNDGMVAVVGKSSFYREDQTKGDLYQRLNLSGLAGTENIILRTLIGDELAEKVDSLLTNYYKKAWIIPIPVPRNLETKSEIDIFVKEYEQKLGQWISNDKKIPILNVYSHQH